MNWQLDDWVLCRIYEKSTHAPRAGQENDMDSMLASLPQMIDPGLHSSLAGADSTALVESMIAGDNNDSETSSLATSLPMMNMSHNSGAISVHHDLQTSAALGSAWELHQDVATTSHQNQLDKARFVQELQTGLGNLPAMAGRFRQFQQRSYSSINNVPDLVERSYNAIPTGRSPTSDEESQTTFQSSVFGLDSMYPALGYDHRADQSTVSYATPGLTETSVHPSARIPPNFNFSFGPGSGNNFNNFNN